MDYSLPGSSIHGTFQARILEWVASPFSTFHAKMGTIKDKNGMNLSEQKKLIRSGKNTQKLHKKDLHDPDYHDDVITHLEPDILECEVKWAL